MEYLENNESYWGNNIDDVYQALQEYKKQGQKYQVQFNGKLLNCDMTLDECYILVTGMSYKDFHDKLQEMYEESQKELEEHKARTPELVKKWKKWGKENLSFFKRIKWNKCVPIRLDDLYQGWELDCFKEFFEAYKAGKSKKELKQVLQDQGHSGMSYGLICSMIYSFIDKDLAEYLHNI